MPQRWPSSATGDAAPPPAADVGARAALPPPVLAVIARAASVPNALAVIERAPVECASVLLGVRPADVERTRAALASPLARAAASEALFRATASEKLARAARRTAPALRAPAPAPTPATAEALVRAAERMPGGVLLLVTASPEAAAVTFSVRPRLVLEARALLAARGAAADGGEVLP